MSYEYLLDFNEPRTIRGYYGSEHTPGQVHTYRGWYACHGSVNVLHTWQHERLEHGIDVETLKDDEIFTVQGGIHSPEELKQHVEEIEEYLSEC